LANGQGHQASNFHWRRSDRSAFLSQPDHHFDHIGFHPFRQLG